MARPRKILTNEQEQEINEMDEFGVKQVQRVISKNGLTRPDMGYFSGADVDTYLSAFLRDGWKLQHVFYLGENPEGYIIWYVLVKQ